MNPRFRKMVEALEPKFRCLLNMTPIKSYRNGGRELILYKTCCPG